MKKKIVAAREKSMNQRFSIFSSFFFGKGEDRLRRRKTRDVNKTVDNDYVLLFPREQHVFNEFGGNRSFLIYIYVHFSNTVLVVKLATRFHCVFSPF